MFCVRPWTSGFRIDAIKIDFSKACGEVPYELFFYVFHPEVL